MKEEYFIKKLIEMYREAREPKFSHDKIRRGRSHSISSIAEDLFAHYLVQNIEVDSIYVDQPITVGKIKDQSYPDIILEKNGVLADFMDLKMDMGWHRDGLYSLCAQKHKWINFARGKDCKIRDGKDKVDTFHKISENASFNIVIISDKNANKEKINAQILKSKRFNPDVEVFVLSSNEHLNKYGLSVSELMKKVNIKEKEAEFSRLLKKLEK
jgi:hypothetical protein